MRVDSLAELIRLAQDARMGDVHTALPGKIVTYDPVTLTATVQLVITRMVKTQDDPLQLQQYEREVLPPLQGVPIVFPRSSNASITWPLAPGDSVLVVFCEADISRWLMTGSITDPDMLKRHSLSSGFAIPGIAPITSPLPSAAVPAMVLTANTVKLGSMAATSFVALATLVAAELSSIATALSTHIHGGVTAGPAATLAAGPVYTPGSVAATKVLAE
jgi:hypothetical protein